MIKSYGMLESLIDENGKRLGDSYVELEGRRDTLKNLCELFDSIVYNDLEDPDEYEVSIDELTNEIVFKVIVPDVVIEDASCGMYRMIAASQRFSVKNYKRGSEVEMKFVFPSIWGDC